MIRVPFFLLFGFVKGTSNEKGQKGTTGEPSEPLEEAGPAPGMQTLMARAPSTRRPPGLT